MTSDCRELVAGSAISFPAGSSNLDFERYRVITPGSDRLAEALSVFPQLRRLFNASVPLIVGCYPAALGSFPSAVLMDTYLRPANFARAMALAAAREMTAIVISQPLIIADMLVQTLRVSARLPQRMLIAVGGYAMPASLERFVRTLLHVGGCEHFEILHAYGVAEVDFGILAAIRDEGGALAYQPLARDIELRVLNGRIELRRQPGEWVRTDDHAEADDRGLLIHGNPVRQHPLTLAELERWDYDRWWRFSGRLGGELAGRQRQLREHIKDVQEGELGFHAFFDICGGSVLDKPDLGLGIAASRQGQPSLTVPVQSRSSCTQASGTSMPKRS